jgi:hypothetical protein
MMPFSKHSRKSEEVICVADEYDISVLGGRLLPVTCNFLFIHETVLQAQQTIEGATCVSNECVTIVFSGR